MNLIDKLCKERRLDRGEWLELLSKRAEYEGYAAEKAVTAARERFGDGIFIRGLVEFTNYCRNDCYYCGIRASNGESQRYRLNAVEILDYCAKGYTLGYRTFVLQGGEDPRYTDALICEIVSSIKMRFPDCAVTLSIGEKSRESYEMYKYAGADRYLLRHETADETHYSRLHPSSMSLENRKRCLFALKELGYQTGAGFMVGTPYQTLDNIASDLLFIQELRPEMIGVGPFIPHKDTPFANFDNKDGLSLTLYIVSLLRLLDPDALIPATTAVGTLSADGREQAILRGANVVMPNLSPVDVRGKYLLYDGKICTGDEAAECKACLERKLSKIGYHLVVGRGDYGSARLEA